MREARPKNRGTAEAIDRTKYEVVGERRERTANQIPQERPPKPDPNPKIKIPKVDCCIVEEERVETASPRGTPM